MHSEMEQPTLGEIYRKLIENQQALEAFAVEMRDGRHVLRNELTKDIGAVQNQLLQYIAPIAIHGHQMSVMEKTVEAHSAELKAVSALNARMSGGAIVLSIVGTIAVNVVTWLTAWRH